MNPRDEEDAPKFSPDQEDCIGTAEDQVMSEVHLGCPPNHSGAHISHFTISLPSRDEPIEDSFDPIGAKVVVVDEDGDLIVTRRHNSPKDSFVLSIQHNITSSIPRVGLQVWRAEMVLADFVLHMIYSSSKFDGIVVIELGAGTGLAGMLLARAAKTVFITDLYCPSADTGEEVLENSSRNVHLNTGIFHHEASVYVRELDWKCRWPPDITLNSSCEQSYNWKIADIEELQAASLLVAADVIYSDDLTDDFFNILDAIMSEGLDKVLYLALEKRYNFSIDDLDVVANGYSRFRSYLQDPEEEDNIENNCSSRFTGRLVNLEEIPQYVQEYDRGHDVEIWEIKYVKRI